MQKTQKEIRLRRMNCNAVFLFVFFSLLMIKN